MKLRVGSLDRVLPRVVVVVTSEYLLMYKKLFLSTATSGLRSVSNSGSVKICCNKVNLRT